MTTKNIQDVVADFEKKISSCTHVHGFHTCVLDDPEDKETYKQRAKGWLTTTLTQLVKEVEAGEYKSGVEQTIAQFLRMNLENPKAPVNVDEVKRRALSERV